MSAKKQQDVNNNNNMKRSGLARHHASWNGRGKRRLLRSRPRPMSSPTTSDLYIRTVTNYREEVSSTHQTCIITVLHLKNSTSRAYRSVTIKMPSHLFRSVEVADGRVHFIRPPDEKHKGSGFVTFRSFEDAERTIALLDQKYILDNKDPNLPTNKPIYFKFMQR